MRTDWDFTVLAFIPRVSIPGSISATDQYAPPGFVVQTTKFLEIQTRTTNVFVGIDSSGLYVGQDIIYIPGITYPNTKILQINEGINVISTQSTTIGINTTILSGIDTTGITTETKILLIQNVIAQATSVVSVLPNSVEIFPPSLNFAGVSTSNVSFYEGNGEYSITLSARTTNNFDEFLELDFGIGTVVGVGSTFIFNAEAYFPSGSQKVFVEDELAQIDGIIGPNNTVTGIDTYVKSSFISFSHKTEINPYRYLGAGSSSVSVGGISTLVALGDYVRGPFFTNNTVVTSIVGGNIGFQPPSLNTFALETQIGFTRPVSISPITNTIGINTTGIFVDDYVVSAVTDPDTFVTSVGINEIVLSRDTINGTFTTGNIGVTTNIITGINTARIQAGLTILEIPGVLSTGAVVSGFVRNNVTLNSQFTQIGVNTSRLYNINTTGFTTDPRTKIFPITGIIGQETTVTSVIDPIAEGLTFDNTTFTFDSDDITFDSYPVQGYLTISPNSLNSVGIATTVTFYNEIVSVRISKFTENLTPIEDQLFNIYVDTDAEFLFGQYNLVEDEKNRIYLSQSGINTVSVGVATFVFGFTGGVSKVTTAEDYGDLLDVTFQQEKKNIGITASTIGINTSQISVGQYLNPVTEVFDNQSGTFVTSVGEEFITINVGSSNTSVKSVNLKIGNLITKESKRYSYDTFDSYTIQFLSQFARAFVTENTAVFPAYANPAGSSNGDPSLRYSFTSMPTEWDVNKVLGRKDFPYDINSRELAAARGRRNYESPLYPRHVFGR